MKEIKIKQLGNGGAFDYLSINSSFLIESTKESYFLFDCGYSVYAELRRQDALGEIDLNKLKYIYISHMDDDHMGSLKTLIYYMFFIKKKRVHILAYSDVFRELKAYLSDIDGIVENGVKVKDSLFNLIEIPYCDCTVLDSVKIYPTPTMHFKPCWGLRFQLDGDNEFLISADTKAHRSLANCLSHSTVKFAFHDYSNWNQEDSQVHCCESDYERLYVNTKHKIIKYHNNEEFDGSWRSFNQIVDSLPKKRLKIN